MCLLVDGLFALLCTHGINPQRNALEEKLAGLGSNGRFSLLFAYKSQLLSQCGYVS